MHRIDKEIKDTSYQNSGLNTGETDRPWIRDKIQLFAFLSAISTFFTVLVSFIYLASAGYFEKPKPVTELNNKPPGFEMKYLYAIGDSLNAKKNRLAEKVDSLQYEITEKKSALKILDRRTEKTLQENSLLSINYFLSKDGENIVLQNKYIAEITALIGRYDAIIARAASNDSAAYSPDEYFQVYQPAKVNILSALVNYRITKHKDHLTEIDRLIRVLDQFTYPIELNLLQSEIKTGQMKKERFLNNRDSI